MVIQWNKIISKNTKTWQSTQILELKERYNFNWLRKVFHKPSIGFWQLVLGLEHKGHSGGGAAKTTFPLK